MELELFPLLSTIILVSTIVTIVLALFSYIAYRAREKKRPAPSTSILALQLPAPPPAIQSPLFRRYEPTR